MKTTKYFRRCQQSRLMTKAAGKTKNLLTPQSHTPSPPPPPPPPHNPHLPISKMALTFRRVSNSKTIFIPRVPETRNRCRIFKFHPPSPSLLFEQRVELSSRVPRSRKLWIRIPSHLHFNSIKLRSTTPFPPLSHLEKEGGFTPVHPRNSKFEVPEFRTPFYFFPAFFSTSFLAFGVLDCMGGFIIF